MAGTGRFLTLKEWSDEVGLSYKGAWKFASQGLIPGLVNMSPSAKRPTYRVSRTGLEKFIRDRKEDTERMMKDRREENGTPGASK